MTSDKKFLNKENKILKLENKKKKLYKELTDLKKNNKTKTSWLFKAKYHTNYNKIEKTKRRIKKLKYKIGVIKSFQYDLIYDYLNSRDNKFKKLIDENKELLINKSISFITKRSNISMTGSHSIKFNGELLDSGKIKCESMQTDIALLGFQKGIYPKSYDGKINSIGLLGMKVRETGYALGGRIPTHFEGKINSDGNFIVKTTGSHLEFGGMQYVKFIEGKIFFKSMDELQTFLKNKNEMIKIIDDYRKCKITSLNSTNKAWKGDGICEL